MKLNLGVIDLPYSYGNKVATTGDVAGYLENKYHVMEIYYLQNEEKIASKLASSLAESLENILMGAPIPPNPYAAAESFTEHGFRVFLDRDSLAKLGYPGTPTAAALKGVNHRLKIKKGPPRPSFIDTGLYQTTFKCWVV